MITWNIIRAAGVGAFLMLWASVAWGLISTTSALGKKAPRATTVALHQAFSTSGLLLLVTHVVALLLDRFMPFTPLDLIVPLRATYRPVGVAFGIGAMFVMLLGVLSTSWGRKLIGTKWWRRTHSLSVPAFTLALLHGLMTGTDTARPAMFWMYVVSAAVLLFLLALRALTAGQRPERAAPPHGVTPRPPTATRAGARPAATSPRGPETEAASVGRSSTTDPGRVVAVGRERETASHVSAEPRS
jgi:methionine sulfoxide reductase heme-binding subunit